MHQVLVVHTMHSGRRHTQHFPLFSTSTNIQINKCIPAKLLSGNYVRLAPNFPSHVICPSITCCQRRHVDYYQDYYLQITDRFPVVNSHCKLFTTICNCSCMHYLQTICIISYMHGCRDGCMLGLEQWAYRSA